MTHCSKHGVRKILEYDYMTQEEYYLCPACSDEYGREPEPEIVYEEIACTRCGGVGMLRRDDWVRCNTCYGNGIEKVRR